MKITIDTTSMTLGEMEDFEESSGTSIGALEKLLEGKDRVRLTDVPIRVLTSLVWLFARREEPGITLDDVRNTSLNDLEFGDPPAAAGVADSAATSRPSRSSTTTRRKSSGI